MKAIHTRIVFFRHFQVEMLSLIQNDLFVFIFAPLSTLLLLVINIHEYIPLLNGLKDLKQKQVLHME